MTTTVTNANIVRYVAQAKVQSNNITRYSGLINVYQQRVFRYESFMPIESQNVTRYGVGFVQSQNISRYSISNKISATNITRYSPSGNAVVVTNPGGGTGIVSLPDGTEMSVAQFAYTFNTFPAMGAYWVTNISVKADEILSVSTSLTQATILKIALKESQPITWVLDLLDTDGTINPENLNSTFFGSAGSNAVLNGQPFYSPIPYNLELQSIEGVNIDGSGTIANPFMVYTSQLKLNRKIIFDIKLMTLPGAIQTKTFAEFNFTGIQTKYKFSQDPISRIFKLTLSGVDISYPLFFEDQNMSTLRQNNATDAVAQICLAYNVPCNLFRMNNYVINIMQRTKSKPIDWIKKILEPIMNEWQVQNDVFTVYDPQFGPGILPQFVYDANINTISNFESDSMNTNIVNVVVATRAKLATNSVDVMVNKWGQYSANFPTYWDRVQWVAENGTVFGEFSDFYWKTNGVVTAVTDQRNLNQAGVPQQTITVGNQQVFQRSPNNVNSVTFTWGAPDGINPGSFQGVPFGRIRFYGIPHNDSFTNVSGLNVVTVDNSDDDVYTLVGIDQTSVVLRGVFKRELTVSSLIGNSIDLSIYIVKYLQRMARDSRVVKYKVPLNVSLFPGMAVEEIHEQIYIDNIIYVTEVNHSISDDPNNRYTEFTAVLYEAAGDTFFLINPATNTSFPLPVSQEL